MRPPFLEDPEKQWTEPDDGSVDMTPVMNGESQVIGNPRRHLLRREAADEEDVLAPPIQPLPHVDLSHFEPYLERVGSLLGEWRANHAGAAGGEESAVDEEQALRLEMQRVVDIVPSMFFSAEFSLVDRSIFAIMSDSAVQSRLPVFLEYVELCLLKQIASRSDHFFAALKELQELATYIAASSAKVCEIRRYVQTMQQDVVARAMSVPAKSRAHGNATTLKALVVKIDELKRAPKRAGALYAENRPLEAARVLTAARRLHRTELRKVKMLKGTGAKLDKLEAAMSERMFRNFSRCSKSLRYRAATAAEIAAAAAAPAPPPPKHIADPDEFAELVASVHATAVLGKSKQLVATYEEHLSKTIKSKLRTVVAAVVNPSAAKCSGGSGGGGGGGGGGGAGGAEAEEKKKPLAVGPFLKGLCAAEFLSIIQLVQEHLARLLVRAGLVHDSICAAMDIFVEEHVAQLREAEAASSSSSGSSSSGSSSSGSSSSAASGGASGGAPAVEATGASTAPAAGAGRSAASGARGSSGGRRSAKSCARALERAKEASRATRAASEATMGKAWKIAEYHMGKMLEVRKSQSRDKVEDLVALWESTQKFVAFAQTQSHTQGGSRSGGGGSALMATLGAKLKTHVAQRQQRDAAQLTAALDRENWRQAQVSYRQQLLATSVFKCGEGEQWLHLRAKLESRVKASESSAHGQVVPGELRYGSQRWKVVGGLLVLTAMLCEYLDLAHRFPAMAQLVTRGVLNLVQLFNQRSTELILGAQARSTAAKLQTISARHLALLSQCLGLTIAALPGYSAALCALCPAGEQRARLEEQFKSKTKDYEAHQERIFSKFVHMISELVAHKCAEVTRIQWGSEESSSGAEAQPSAYMREMVSDISKLHKVLKMYLQAGEVQTIFGRIVALLNEELPRHFAAVEPSGLSIAGAKQVLADIGHLVACLRAIRGLRDKGKTLDRWVRDRYVYTMSRARRTSTFSSASLEPVAAVAAVAAVVAAEVVAERPGQDESGAAAALDAPPAPAPPGAAPLDGEAGAATSAREPSAAAGAEASGAEARGAAPNEPAAPATGEAKGAVEEEEEPARAAEDAVE